MPERVHTRSEALFEQARKLIPGGVNSPVRAFGGVGGTPVFFQSGRGDTVTDVDGNTYIDYVGSWGPLILGHADPRIVKAVAEAAGCGTSFGAPTEAEVTLARMVSEAVPSMEVLRLVSSGTEACMSAIRVARGYTGRSKIVKFNGCYHGHADGLLVKAGSGAATFSVPTSAGVPASYASETLVAEYNDLGSVEALFTEQGRSIAAVIVEPVAGNMGVVAPRAGFLEGLWEITRRHGALLILDEVITGFRIAYGGAQAKYGIMPDITCLGKIIGGGLPVGAYGGRRAIMERVSPLGPVYQAGTLSGNPVATAAGIAMLRALAEPGTYEALESKASALEAGLRSAARSVGVPVAVNRAGSVLTVFFQPGPVTTWSEAAQSDTKRYARFFHAMLEQGVYLPPSQYEAWFVSLAHTEASIKRTIAAAQRAFAAVVA